ncbi:MAG: hypothetical protein GY853_01975 [PVC group bacterium]|nr:hypothetical protein [PVC group bacterium]
MKVETEIKLTPDILAKIFINWGDDEQALFINLVGKHFKESDFDAELQCCYISEHIKKEGKDFIYTLANFVKVQKFDTGSPHFNMLSATYEGSLHNNKGLKHE